MKQSDRTAYAQLRKMPYLTSISCSSQGCASGTCDFHLCLILKMI